LSIWTELFYESIIGFDGLAIFAETWWPLRLKMLFFPHFYKTEPFNLKTFK